MQLMANVLRPHPLLILFVLSEEFPGTFSKKKHTKLRIVMQPMKKKLFYLLYYMHVHNSAATLLYREYYKNIMLKKI